jgi:hypothetical protein
MMTILSALISILGFHIRSRASLELELISLRHQASVLRRQHAGRIRRFSTDRLLWVWLYRIWPQVLAPWCWSNRQRWSGGIVRASGALTPAIETALAQRLCFDRIVISDTAEAATLYIIAQRITDAVSLTSVEASPADRIISLCHRFPLFVERLQRRQRGRDAFEVADEYDVQDLLHATLKLHFDARLWVYTVSQSSSTLHSPTRAVAHQRWCLGMAPNEKAGRSPAILKRLFTICGVTTAGSPTPTNGRHARA